MSVNSFCHNFVITTFGESFGPALGVIVSGCPPGINFDFGLLEDFLARRRPGNFGGNYSYMMVGRQEADAPEVLSGIYEGYTLGNPIAIIIRNNEIRPADYGKVYRHGRGHAHDLWLKKYGIVDICGGGRSSAREAVARVAAGAIAQMVLRKFIANIEVVAFVSQMGPLTLSANEILLTTGMNSAEVDQFTGRLPVFDQKSTIILLEQAVQKGESFGGKIKLLIKNMPTELSQEVLHNIKNDLVNAIMSIGGVCAVQFEDEINQNNSFVNYNQDVEVNNYCHISCPVNNKIIVIEITFQPSASLGDFAINGKHDPCVMPRAIPVVEAMASLVLVDHLI